MKTVDAYHHAKQWAGNILNAPTNGILCNTWAWLYCMYEKKKNLQYIKGKKANQKIAYKTIFF